MRAFTIEGIFNRYQAGAQRLAPRCLEVVADMGEEHGVDAFEHPVAHHECLARDQFFGDSRPKQQRAGDVVALH